MIKKALIVLLIIAPLIAQGQIYLGARAGYGVSAVEFTPTQKERAVYDDGLDFGFSIKHFNLQYIGFQCDMSLARKGYRKPIEDSIFYKRINSYLEMPIYMQVRMQKRGLFMHFNAGCYGAYLVNSEAGDNRWGEYQLHEYQFNILKDNRFDYGLIGTVGIGYETLLGVFQIDFRYTWGLGDLYYHKYEDVPGRSPVRVQNLSLSYYWNISRKKSNDEKPLGNNNN